MFGGSPLLLPGHRFGVATVVRAERDPAASAGLAAAFSCAGVLSLLVSVSLCVCLFVSLSVRATGDGGLGDGSWRAVGKAREVTKEGCQGRAPAPAVVSV